MSHIGLNIATTCDNEPEDLNETVHSTQFSGLRLNERVFRDNTQADILIRLSSNDLASLANHCEDVRDNADCSMCFTLRRE